MRINAGKCKQQWNYWAWKHNVPSLRHKSTAHCNQLKCFLRLVITLTHITAPTLLLIQSTNWSARQKSHNNQICTHSCSIAQWSTRHSRIDWSNDDDDVDDNNNKLDTIASCSEMWSRHVVFISWFSRCH